MKMPGPVAAAGMLTVALGFMLLWCFPIMEVSDGCPCGYQRTWYEMPDSPWHRKQMFRRTDNAGKTSHSHALWDAQWRVWMDLPWRK
ncbi:MAG: hypothetical protein V4584_08385 [Verrucomicrobiota bacterium]